MQNSIEKICKDYVEKLKQNFWKRVEKTENCWVWKGALFVGQGYGALGRIFDRKVYPAHRISWMLNCGEIPEGYHVLHKCDNRPCIRPDHLFLGSDKDNHDDMVKKMRHAHGENQWKAKLTTENVREIRSTYKFRKMTAKMLAIKFGVSPSTVRDVLYRRIWKHVI